VFVWPAWLTTVLKADPLGAVRVLGQFAGGHCCWRWIDHGRAATSTTHIENLVDAIDLALTEGRPREAYFILDEGESRAACSTSVQGMTTSLMVTGTSGAPA